MLKLGLPIALLALTADQVSKWMILNHVMAPPQVIPITGFFNLVLGRNTGVSFGLFGDASPWALIALTLAIVAGLLVWLQRAEHRLTAVSLGLIAGGALGNLIDRLRHGAVTDFLDFYLATYHWPAFNLADVAIVSGVGLLLLESILPRDEAKGPKKHPDVDPMKAP
ncbi:signal peptidase II [Mesorhizobium microcysteis]|uniref:Lipoprotein signal peptidase n=1 Tax=Neoaquamicrobium microcysteis TaxID=2682781 RepID=A0A5D4GX65_9HYPH|nr:signal peptidase II [Mesorhizobium microcysteis]TYR33461.1 signal peptidase II [Mesorhizobium microcysteis]